MASVIEKSIRKAVTAGIGAAANFNRKRLDYGNAFLTGIHTPMAEEATLEDLRVSRVIPSELDGRYVRIGPNPLHADGRGHHWFVGDGMVHGVRLREGRAEWYRNRWIRSNELAGKAGLEAAPGPRRGPSDNVNTNIVQLGNQTLAMVEAGSYPVALSDELESIAYSDFGGGLAGSFTAHPHHDPATGEWHAICYDAMAPNRITHVALDGSGKVLRELPIAVEHGPSIHDCALTPNFVVILDQPVTFSMGSLIGGFRFPYRWNRQHQARVGLLPRDGAAADVTWHPVDPCYSFHVGNSFEDAKGRVVIDLCVYETMFDGELTGPFGKSLGLERWTVDPRGGAVTRRTLDATPQEFPRPDERFFGKDYRFLWSVESKEGDADFFGHAPIVRHDLAAGTRTSRSFGNHAVPGEFVFVPRSDDALEGEGWLMGYVIDRALDTTDLAILDATTLEDVARVHIPHRIPPGFHGNWMPAN